MNYKVCALAVLTIGVVLALLAGAVFLTELRFHAWESSVAFAIYTLEVVLAAVSPSVYLYGRLNDLFPPGGSSG